LLSLPLAYTRLAWAAAVPPAVAVAGVAVDRHAKERLRRVAALLSLLGLLLLSAVVSAAVHPSGQAAPVLATLAACSALTVVLALGTPREAITLLLSLATLIALLLLVWVQLVDPELLATKSPAGTLLPHTPVLGRLSIGPHPNVAGVMASMAAPGWLGLALAARRRPGLLTSAAMLALSVAILVASGSRAGALAAVAGGMVVVLRFRRAGVALLGAAVLAAAATPAWAPRAVPLLTAGSGNDQARLPAWEATLRGILQSPWLGRGIGSFPFAYARVPGADPVAIGAHNTYLQVWLDFGLLGLVAVTGLTVLVVVTCLRRRAATPMGTALAGVAAAWFVISMFESTVIMTWRAAQPWEGFQEVVVPLAFILFGVAAAPLTVMGGDLPAHNSASGDRRRPAAQTRSMPEGPP
jgi:O-antigen ligase